ncbi:alpha/beta fold hydrolase [Candidatus Omnitrophota bacterium]
MKFPFRCVFVLICALILFASQGKLLLADNIGDLEYTIELEGSAGKETIAILPCSEGEHTFIAIHGATTTNHLMRWENLWSKGEVILAGLPGHGEVPQYGRSHYLQWTPQHFIDVGVATVKKYSQGRAVTLIGHSFGGGVALGVALEAPELVERLIVVDPVVWPKLGGLDAVVMFMCSAPPVGRLLINSIVWYTKRSLSEYSKGFEAFVSKSNVKTFCASPKVKKVLARSYTPYVKTPGYTFSEIYMVMKKFDLRSQLKDNPFRIPTLIIHGDQDPSVPLMQAEWLAKALPDADLVVLPDTGHLGFLENEEFFNEQVENWLDAHPVN